MKYCDGHIVKIGDKIIRKYRLITPQAKVVGIMWGNKIKVKFDTGKVKVCCVKKFKLDKSSIEIEKQPKGW
jgi:hypothetical protein